MSLHVKVLSSWGVNLHLGHIPSVLLESITGSLSCLTYVQKIFADLRIFATGQPVYAALRFTRHRGVDLPCLSTSSVFVTLDVTLPCKGAHSAIPLAWPKATTLWSL